MEQSEKNVLQALALIATSAVTLPEPKLPNGQMGLSQDAIEWKERSIKMEVTLTSIGTVLESLTVPAKVSYAKELEIGKV